jgi:ribulose-phosphate 3-epimerase
MTNSRRVAIEKPFGHDLGSAKALNNEILKVLQEHQFYRIDLCDVVLVTIANPGFGGQTRLPEMLPKIRRLRAICAERDLHPVIEVDGGENIATAGQAAAGVTAVVAGSAIFGTKHYAAAIAAIHTNAIAASQS